MGKQQSQVKWLNRPLSIATILWLCFSGILWVIDRPVKDDVVVGIPIDIVILGIPLYQMEKLGAFRKTAQKKISNDIIE